MPTDPNPSGIPAGPENLDATTRIRAFLDVRYSSLNRDPVVAYLPGATLLEYDLETLLQMVHLVSGLLEDQDSQEPSAGDADVRP